MTRNTITIPGLNSREELLVRPAHLGDRVVIVQDVNAFLIAPEQIEPLINALRATNASLGHKSI